MLLYACSKRTSGDEDEILLYSNQPPVSPPRLDALAVRLKKKRLYMSFKNGLEVVLDVGQSWQSYAGLLGSDIVAINFIRDSVASSSSYRVKPG